MARPAAGKNVEEDARHGMRFAPKLQDFKRHLLRYDLNTDIVDDRDMEKQFVEVPLHFENAAHYIEVFQPLYWEEMKMQIFRSKQTEMTTNSECVRMSKYKMEEKLLQVSIIRPKDEAQMYTFSPHDLVLMSQNKDPRHEEKVHFLGLCESNRGVDLTMSACIEAQTKKHGSRELEVAKVIAARGDWHMAKVMQCSTNIREYEGLMSLPHIPLLDVILNTDDTLRNKDTSSEMQAAPKRAGTKASAKLGASLEGMKLSIPGPLEEQLLKKNNSSQMAAVRDSCKAFGITLVQGPPGTGKTTTILGILAVLLNAQADVKKEVNYSPAAQGQRKDGGESEASDSGGEKENGAAANEARKALEERRRERLKRLRGQSPWFHGNFVPWQDTLEQELLGPGRAEWREPYPKLKADGVVRMSEVRESVAPQKVLVCAPSNAAIDEVVRRLVKEKLLNARGTLEQPDVIRMGLACHESLSEYCLEKMVKKRQSSQTEKQDVKQEEQGKQRLIRNAKVVCTTLSMTGSRELVGFPGDFDTVVVDEASQGVELSMLVPLKLGCRRLILVGDPQQLPATVFSGVAKKHSYDRSLFQRLQESKHQVNMLTAQYRMHPDISAFPSQHFYDGRLLDVLDTQAFEKKYPCAWSGVACFAPVVFFNVAGEEQTALTSYINDDEGEFIIHLFDTLSKLYPPKIAWQQRLAVITPYSEQVQLIRRKFKAFFGIEKGHCPVDVNTVDGFQGREKECIIVSAVRANDKASVGFLQDTRRMNVAFTRARRNLWVVGSTKNLRNNPDWRAFVDLQASRARVLRVPRPFNHFLHGYLIRWYERHPDVPKNPELLEKWRDSLPQTQEPNHDQEEQAKGFTWSSEKVADTAEAEKTTTEYRRDIEEVSADESIASEGGAASDGQDVDAGAMEDDALDDEPAAKRQRADAGEEDVEAQDGEYA